MDAEALLSVHADACRYSLLLIGNHTCDRPGAQHPAAEGELTVFERYTEEARRVIFFARYEASRLGAPVLEIEHLWLGLLRESKKAVRRLAPRVTVEAIHERLLAHGLNAQRISMAVGLPLSKQVKRVLASAIAEADGRSQHHVTDEYLILALLHEEVRVLDDLDRS